MLGKNSIFCIKWYHVIYIKIQQTRDIMCKNNYPLIHVFYLLVGSYFLQKFLSFIGFWYHWLGIIRNPIPSLGTLKSCSDRVQINLPCTRPKPSQPNNKKLSRNSLSSLNLFPFYDLYILHLHHLNDTTVCITYTISCSIMCAYNKRKTRIPNRFHSQIKGESKDRFAFPLNLFL